MEVIPADIQAVAAAIAEDRPIVHQVHHLQEQNDETIRDENRRMSNYRNASFQFDDADSADED